MIPALIQWCVRNRLIVMVAALVLVIWGAVVGSRMPMDVLPDLDAPTVTVLTEAPGMAPEQMEQLVTYRIETAVQGATGVRRVRSATAVGLSVVWVEFDWQADPAAARQAVAERLGAVQGRLPEGVESPMLAPVASIMGEVMFAALSSDEHDAMQLYTAARTQLQPRLQALDGVAHVVLTGGDLKQYQANLSSSRAAAYGLAVPDVVDALRRANEDISAGVRIDGSQESVVEGLGRFRSAEDIAATLIVHRAQTPVRIGDVAEVRAGPAIKRGEGSVSYRADDGDPVTRPAVIIAIQKEPGVNTLRLTDEIDAAMADIAAALPAGMHLETGLLRQSRFIDAAVQTTLSALIEAAVLVVIVVALFLFTVRATLITLVAIPVSLLAALLTLDALGGTINAMTLGGLAIAIGAVVDDAIIDVENCVRRLRLNASLPADQQRPALQVVYLSSVEVRRAIIYATLIVLLVFTPLLMLHGVEGRLLASLGVAFIVALTTSLVVALTLTPALCAYLLPGSPAVRRTADPWLVRLAKRAYRRPLGAVMRHPVVAVVPAIVLLVVSLVALPWTGRAFLPSFNEGALVVNVNTLPGTSLAESDRLAGRVQQRLIQQPEVVSVGRRTGRGEEDEHVQGVTASELDVVLDMSRGGHNRSQAELVEVLREEVATVPGVQVSFSQPITHRIDHMLTGAQAPIVISIFGPELDRLQAFGQQVRHLVEDVPGIADVFVEQQGHIPATRLTLDRAALARYGIDARHAGQVLRSAYAGQPAGQVFDGPFAYDLVVRTGQASPRRLDELGRLRVRGPNGELVPLDVLAEVQDETAADFIRRENTQRQVMVQASVHGADLGGVVEQIRADLRDHLALPEGYHIAIGGQHEAMQAATQRLLLLGALAVIGTAVLLYLCFGSIRDALLVMLNLPLALIGGMIGVFLGGGVISLASLIGFITVFGIAARNGILLISHIRHLHIEEGVTDFDEAVRRGSVERVAPILMTAVSTGLAMVPLALRPDAPGAEILHPMALVIFFGLLTSTLLNLLLVPGLYRWFGRPAAQPGLASTDTAVESPRSTS